MDYLLWLAIRMSAYSIPDLLRNHKDIEVYFTNLKWKYSLFNANWIYHFFTFLRRFFPTLKPFYWGLKKLFTYWLL